MNKSTIFFKFHEMTCINIYYAIFNLLSNDILIDHYKLTHFPSLSFMHAHTQTKVSVGPNGFPWQSRNERKKQREQRSGNRGGMEGNTRTWQEKWQEQKQGLRDTPTEINNLPQVEQPSLSFYFRFFFSSPEEVFPITKQTKTQQIVKFT